MSDVVDLEEARFPDSEGVLELLVTQIDYTVERNGREEYPVVHVFGRTADNEAEHVRVLGVEPYFYVPTADLEGDLTESYDVVVSTRETDRDGEPFESIRGESLTKVITRTPRDVGNIRDDFETTFEADILFPNRFLIDNGISGGIRVEERRLEDGRLQVHEGHLEPAEVDADLRVHMMDIEVDDRSGFPEDGEEPIICLTSHDSYRDEYVAWLFDAPDGDAPLPTELDGYEPLRGDVDVRVETFDDEESMLDAYLEYIDETDPDLTSGWNLDDFDAPYLLDRLERLDPHTDRDLSIERLSRIGEVWRSGWGGPDIKGRVVFDLLYAYKRTQFTELESYRLDAVGELELDIGKERYPGDIGDLWEQDPERLLEYNLRDVELCVEIDRKQDVIAFWEEARKVVGCKLEDAPTPGDAVDMYVLHKASGTFALPSKGQQESEDFEGGAVFEPVTGVREMVTVLDLKCFSGDTQVLTPTGVKNITDISEGDEVYSLNPETFECEVTSVAETQEYPNQFGELHHLSGNTHDLKVTENHRFLYSNDRGWDGLGPDDFQFDAYRDIPEYDRYAFPNHIPMEGEQPETFDFYREVDGGSVVLYAKEDLRAVRNALPKEVTDELDLARGTAGSLGLQKVGKYLLPVELYREHADEIDACVDEVYLKYGRGHREVPLQFEMVDWLELIGWFVAEGSIDEANGRLTIHQSAGESRDGIVELLDRMGINYSVDQRGLNVSNRYLVEWFRENCGVGFANKHLPEWVFDLDAELLEVVLETLVAGDGSVADSGLRKFWTKSDQLKTEIARIAVRCGHKPTVSHQTDGTWYVSIGKRGSFTKSNATIEQHDGNVYCLTAEENHVVLAGRNGNFQWVGQSLYPMCMVTINAGPETKVDPEEYDGETYVAPNGTHFRKTPDGMMREMIDELLTQREEKKALRNEHDPDSEAYEQYDRQQGAVKVIMNCFTPDTEVLTPAGVQGITDLEVGDEVYSLDPDTLEMEVKEVEETHEYPDYRGELVDIETEKIDFRVTPNHRMLVRKNETNGITEDGFGFVEAGDLDRATNYELPHDWTGPDGERIDRVDLTEFVDREYEVWVRPEVHGHTFTANLGWTPRRVPKADVGETGYVFDADRFEDHRGYIESVCEYSYVQTESGRKWIPRTYDGDDFLELVAWYLTEGNVYTSTENVFGDNVRGSATTVKIAQEAATDGGTLDSVGEEEPESESATDVTPQGDAVGDAIDDGSTHATIGRLLDRMGIDYYEDNRSYQFTSKLFGDYLREHCGAGSTEKRVPEFVFEASADQKRHFLETLIDGDGDRQLGSWRYTTASEQLRDDVFRLCAHLGITANYRQDGSVWRIYANEEAKNTLRMHRSSDRTEANDGVFCVTVEDNHTLLAGRNGKFQFVGQSLYGVTGWDRFRLYDKEGAAAVTATGREVISFTEEAASELDKEVTYGDSVTGDRPVVVRDPDGIVRIRPIEELFENAAETTAADVVVTADGGVVGSNSMSKDRRRLEGWEALSLSADRGPEWQPIQQVIRHETDNPVVTLQHKFGESTTTRDHSYVVEEDEKLVEATPDEVEKPLRIPGVPDVETVETIDVYEVLNGYTRKYEDGRSVGSENAETKVKRVHADDEKVWFGHKHHADIDKAITVQRYVDLDSPDGEALIRLLAAYVTEGSASTIETTDSKFGASIAESRREWLEGFKRDYERLFDGATAGIIASDASSQRTIAYDTDSGRETVTYGDGTYKLQMMNELSAVFFREFAGQRSRGKRIPGFVFNLRDDLQELFLEVLVEGDGSRSFPRYSEEYSDRNFDFETTSRELAAGLSTLLTQRSEKHSLKYRKDKGSYTVRTCDFYRRGRDPSLTETEHDGYVYDLSVAENENFVDAVGGIVLHNTDSVMLELGGDISKSDAIETSFDIEDHINERYDDFALEELNAESHRFEIEFEKLYRRFFQAGKKKRYAGHIVWKEGKDVDDVDITGFEYKRSDIAPITKEVQREVIERIVTGDDLESDLEGVKAYLSDVIDDVLAGELSPDEVAIPGGIGKRLDAYETDTAQVRGAKYANLLLGTNFDRGSKPKRLYLKKVHPDFWQRMETEKGLDPQTNPLYGEFKRDPDVICFEYADQIPEEFEIDWEKMLEKTLKGPIERVIEALGMSWEEVKTGQQQTGLGNFM
uniref:DNA polymerase domain-containing protein n=1 Tax=Halalkaliarchaeum desulfuricum TaxID=2055893 RepID=UPI003742398B